MKAKLALNVVAVTLAVTIPTLALAAYYPEAEYYRSTTDTGNGVRLNSNGTAGIGSGAGDWWFTGAFMFVGSSYDNLVGFGVVENKTGWFGSYWKRTGLINMKAGAVSIAYPPYDPNHNGETNNYRIWSDWAAPAIRYSFNGSTNNETITNNSFTVFEHAAGCYGIHSGGTFSMPVRHFTAWERFNGSWSMQPSGSYWPYDDGVTWSFSQSGIWDFKISTK